MHDEDIDDEIEFTSQSNYEKEKQRLKIRRKIEAILEEKRVRQETYDDLFSY